MLIEIVLVISNLLLVLAILSYFYLREIKSKTDDDQRISKIEEFYSQAMTDTNMVFTEQLQTISDLSKSKDDLTQKTLMEYLKHNERLEKMILPQSVTRQAVQEVLSNMPEMVPNDIEKSDKELDQDQLQDLLARVPITKDTKVMFEGDVGSDLPEEIISGSV